MDPEASGKRHTRDGSITVAELIRRQPSFVAAPLPEPVAATDGAAPAPSERLAPADGDRRPNLAARVAAVSVGTLALFGAVTATATISGAPPAGPTAGQLAGAPITGENALRPDLVAERLGYLPGHDRMLLPGVGTTGTQPTTSTGSPAESAAPTTATTPGGNAAGGSSRQGTDRQGTDRPVTDRPVTDTSAAGQPADLVREFYRRLQDHSDNAQALLAPELIGADLPGFRSSWRSVRSVEPVSITAQRDGSVLGTVAVQLSDGTRLRMRQHFYTSDGHPPVIERVELVSVQPS